MKPYSQPLLDNIRSRRVRWANCWKITRTDGQVFAYTEHDVDLTIEGRVYKATNSFSASALESKVDFSVDNLNTTAILDDDDIKETDVKAGKFDAARVEVFGVDWQNPNATILKMRRGRIGEVKVSKPQFEAEIRGLMQLLQQQIGSTYTLECGADLGDARCKVLLDAPVWTALTAYTERQLHDANGSSVVPTDDGTDDATANFAYEATSDGVSGATEPVWPQVLGGTVVDGTVTWVAVHRKTVRGVVAASSPNSIYDPRRSEADDWWRYGKLTFTSGLNAGFAVEVKQSSSSERVLTLWEAAPFDIAIGDTYTVTMGCDKLHNTCIDKFDNLLNNRGFRYMPTQDDAFQYPDRK